MNFRILCRITSFRKVPLILTPWIHNVKNMHQATVHCFFKAAPFTFESFSVALEWLQRSPFFLHLFGGLLGYYYNNKLRNSCVFCFRSQIQAWWSVSLIRNCRSCVYYESGDHFTWWNKKTCVILVIVMRKINLLELCVTIIKSRTNY